jgi:hypothetical protein
MCVGGTLPRVTGQEELLVTARVRGERHRCGS